MKKQVAAACLTLCMLCAACAHTPADREGVPEGQYALCFLAAKEREDDSVLEWEYRDLPEETQGAEELLSALLAGPGTGELRSPFPADTTLRSCKVEEGKALVDLSEAYGGLSGADLSLADGCIVLTLCQLEEVESVYLTVEGRPRPFRDQVLTPADFLLDNALDPTQK